MSRPTPPTYKTRNWPAYNEALKRRGSLTIWFDPEMSWDAAPSGRRGRQQTYSDTAIQTCLTMKVLFGMALRQTTGFVESLLRLVGLDWTVPDFSTLSRRQKTLAVNIPYRGSKGPLHLLIDSTGIEVEVASFRGRTGNGLGFALSSRACDPGLERADFEGGVMFVILLTPSVVAGTTMGMAAIVFGLIGLVVGLFLLWMLVFLIAIPGLTVLCRLGAGETGRRYLASFLGSLLRVLLVLLPFAAIGAAVLYYMDEVADTNWFEVDEIYPWFGPALIGLVGLALLFAMLVFLRRAWRAGQAAGTAIGSGAAAHPERGLFVFRNATTLVILCPLAFAAIPMGLSLGLFLVTDLDQSWLDYVNFSVPTLAVYSSVFIFAMRRGLAQALPAAGTNLTERLLDLARHRSGEVGADAGAISPGAAYAALFVAPLLMFVPGVAGVAGGTWALRNTGGPYEQWHFRNVSSACFHALIVAVLLVATYMTFVPAADSNWGYLALVPLAAAGSIALGIREDLRLGLSALRRADRA